MVDTRAADTPDVSAGQSNHVARSCRHVESGRMNIHIDAPGGGRPFWLGQIELAV